MCHQQRSPTRQERQDELVPTQESVVPLQQESLSTEVAATHLLLHELWYANSTAVPLLAHYAIGGIRCVAPATVRAAYPRAHGSVYSRPASGGRCAPRSASLADVRRHRV